MTNYEKHKVELYSKELERIQAKLAEAEYNYQSTGSASTMRTVRKYETLEDVYRLALETLTGNCRNCSSTERHVRSLLKKYKDDSIDYKSSIIRADLIDLCPEAAIDIKKRP